LIGIIVSLLVLVGFVIWPIYMMRRGGHVRSHDTATRYLDCAKNGCAAKKADSD